MLFSFGEQRMGVGAVDTNTGKVGNIPQCLGDEIILWAMDPFFLGRTNFPKDERCMSKNKYWKGKQTYRNLEPCFIHCCCWSLGLVAWLSYYGLFAGCYAGVCVCLCWGFVAVILWVYEVVLLWCVCGCPTVVCVLLFFCGMCVAVLLWDVWLSYCGTCEAVLLWCVWSCPTVVCVWLSYCGVCVAVLLWYVCGHPTVVCV